MIEFKIKTYKENFELADEICRKFKKPIIFYLGHKNDQVSIFLPTFVIIDFFKKEMLYILSYSQENVEKVKNHKDQKNFELFSFANPHYSLQINPNEDFYTFRNERSYFMYVNYKKNIMRILLGKDLNCENNQKIAEIGSTFFRDDDDKNYFYFTAIESKVDGENMSNIYKAKLDLSFMQLIFQSLPEKHLHAPHMTRKFGNYLLNSEFARARFKNNFTGKIFNDKKALYKHVYGGLYYDFCSQTVRKYSEAEFQECIKIKAFANNNELPHGFKDFCDSKGENIIDICKKNEKYSFSALPGIVSVFDLEKKIMKEYETTFCAPAHFEIDSYKGIVYTSSHNFALFEKMYFLGPAAIDKFIFENGKLVKIGTFSDFTGFRFTSHRVFYYKNKPYICTIGHPNRLFFVDAEKMDLYYSINLFEDILSYQADLVSFLNSDAKLRYITFVALEVSSDGEFIFLIGKDHIYIFSFPERRIVANIQYIFKKSLGNEVFLNDFYNKSIHVNYLD